MKQPAGKNARLSTLALAALAALAAGVAGCGGGDTAVGATSQQGARATSASAATPPPFNFEIETLSNRADLISDGNALVEVRVPKTVPMKMVTLRLNDRDVTASFVADEATRTLRGLLTGLMVGANQFVADSNGQGQGRPWASLTLTNHPRGGPVLLGAQTTPWICATPTPVALVGNTPGSNSSGLSTHAVDAQCNIATEHKLFYRTTATTCVTAIPDPSPPATPSPNNCFKPYIAGSPPADLATTTTSDGLTVPYIVRVERGTLNRGIYDIAVLYDPAKPWTVLAPQPQWNGKVVYSFGASTGQPRLQDRSSQNWADQSALSRGFMVVDHSLTDSSRNSNRVLVSETIMMMKEHIVDSYGPIKYTLGNGCSGGSIQQNTAASIFPGLLDGIQPSCNYPDAVTTGLEVTDCVLLVNAYQRPEWLALMGGLTQAEINGKKKAINGHLDHQGCQAWNNAFGFNNKPGNYVPTLVVNAATGALAPIGAPRNNCRLPAALVYDPVSNPTGTRCGDPDLASMVWGTTDGVAGSRRALSTADNVGVQYGLKAVQAGAIGAEEFVTLNEKIGGVDADSDLIAGRSQADLPALDIAYRAGIVSSGRNLGRLPIIDSRGWDEISIHHIWRTFSERARIAEANGGETGNQVIWRYGTGLLPATAAQATAVTLESLLTMDQWLSNLLTMAPKASLNDARTQAQVIAARPATATDLCYLTGDVNFTTKVTDMALCDADPRLVPTTSPRQVAGGPLAENILKCQLKALNPADYAPVVFSAAQWVRLNATFPDGVCDWSKPGVGQQEAISPLTFVAGPGGQPLPPAPVPMTLPRRN